MARTPTCTHHEGAPALATCVDCEREICGACHQSDARGFAVCPTCRGGSPASSPAWERGETRYSPVGFSRTLTTFLRHPRAAFESFPIRGSWVPAIVYGYVCTVVGMLLGRLGALVLDSSFGEALGEFAAANGLSQAQLELFVVATTPLSALLAVGAHVVALRAAAGFAGADLSWNVAARIGGYALGPMLFLAFPPIYGFEVGLLGAIFWTYNHESSALHHHYDLTRWRASLAVLLPVLVLITCVG